MIIMIVKNHEVSISFKKYKLNRDIVKSIYAVSIPSIVMQAIGSVLITFLNMILIVFSESAVNVMGIYFKLQSFVYMPVFGLNQGVMPVMGYNFGAGKKKRVMDALKSGIFLAACIIPGPRAGRSEPFYVSDPAADLHSAGSLSAV